MKKFVKNVFVSLLIIIVPAMLYGGLLRIMVSYKKSAEKLDHKKVDINDGYWRFPTVEVSKPLEREKYTMIIEGYDTVRKCTETLNLVGAGVSRNSILLPIDGTLVVENKEEFPRKINILQEGDKDEKVEITVPAKSSVNYCFINSGDYTIVDTLFQWNTVYVRVLKSSYLLDINEGPNKIDIPDIAPGTYKIRIFYGTRWIYQEDFVMVSNSSQNIAYKIENNTIFSVNSTLYSTTVSMPGGNED